MECLPTHKFVFNLFLIKTALCPSGNLLDVDFTFLINGKEKERKKRKKRKELRRRSNLFSIHPSNTTGNHSRIGGISLLINYN